MRKIGQRYLFTNNSGKILLVEVVEIAPEQKQKILVNTINSYPIDYVGSFGLGGSFKIMPNQDKPQ